jgi:hypothetical protein
MITRRLLKYFRNLHMGQTAWIVGKGPSLKFLRADHIGDGPVLAINEAILPVQSLGLRNHLYAMQKDGCTHQPCICKPRGEEPPLVVLHDDVTLFLQRPGASTLCFPMHKNAVYVNPEQDLDLPAPAMSIRMCAAIARYMGCTEIVFVACDSLVNGDIRKIDFWTGEVKIDSASAHYLPNNPRLLNDLKGFPYRFLTPEGETA